jgi:flagellin FlaB
MNTLMRCIRKNKRGIVGIEAAIVLIAFVVIAAALAYVVINMGFYSAQTAKSTINKGINEATAALELDGYITGLTDANGNVTAVAIPLKLAVAQQQVDMAKNTVVVAVEGSNFSLANVYNGAIVSSELDVATLITTANATIGANMPNATCFLYNSLLQTDTVLKQNAKAYMVVYLGPSYPLAAYTKVTVEIRTSVGAALMIERDIPGGLPNSALIDLG